MLKIMKMTMTSNEKYNSKGETKMDFRKKQRITFLISFNKALPRECPECGAEVKTSDNEEITCTKCGLVCSAPYTYTAGIQVEYPFRC